MYEDLTREEAEALAEIRSMLATWQVPSRRELAERLGVAPATAHTRVEALQEKGVVAGNGADRNKRRTIRLLQEPPGVSVAVLGEIAAGEPISSEEHITARCWLPQLLVGRSGPHVMFRVSGESMRDAGVHDGDYVVVRLDTQPAEGDMVAARFGTALTVKYLSFFGGRPRLQPHSPGYRPIDPDEFSDDFEVVGKVVAVLRALP